MSNMMAENIMLANVLTAEDAVESAAAHAEENGTACITHGGKFHADEVLGAAILVRSVPNPRIYRLGEEALRIFQEIPGAIVFDCGGGEFDHHHNNPERRGNGIAYSSAGLLWRAFGSSYIKDYCQTEDAAIINRVLGAVDARLVQAVDAVDNGMRPGTDIPLYGISAFIGSLNCPDVSGEEQAEAFGLAVGIADLALRRAIDSELVKVKARSKADELLRTSAFRGNGTVLVLQEYCPWREAVLDPREDTAEVAGTVTHVVHPSSRGGYVWEAVPTSPKPGSALRCETAESLRGLKGEELAEAIGIPEVSDGGFIHPAGFIGGCNSLEATIRMAERLAGILLKKS